MPILNIKQASRRHWPMIIVSVTGVVAYLALVLLRHWHFDSGGFDLGLFDQAMWHYSRWEAPVTTIGPADNILSQHFSPILVLLTPLYWLWSCPEVLLITQVILFGLATLPIYWFSAPRLGRLGSAILVAVFWLFWGTQSAIAFDFHEIAFAVPLIATAIYAIDKRRWWLYWLAVIGLLLIKENLALFVVFVGLYLLVKGEWRRGIITSVIGAAWFGLLLKVIIPLFAAPGVGYLYWSYQNLGATPSAALWYVIRHPINIIGLLFNNSVKVTTLASFFYPLAFLPLISPLVFLSLPLIAERMLSTNELYWLRDFHYTAPLIPVLIMAAADGLNRLRSLLAPPWRRAVIASVLVIAIGANLAELPKFQLWELIHPSYWQLTASDITGQQAVSMIPATATVLAQNKIVPHLSHRSVIQLLGYSSASSDVPVSGADYVIFSRNLDPWPYRDYASLERDVSGRFGLTYRIVFAQGGWTVMQRVALATR